MWTSKYKLQMNEFNLTTEVRGLVREAQNILSTTQDVTLAINTLDRISCLLPEIQCRQTTDFPETVVTPVKEEFAKHHYTRFCDFLLQNLTCDWFKKLAKVQKYSFDVFFINGVHHEAFLMLCKYVQQSSSNFQLAKYTSLLEEFIDGHKMAKLILSQCHIDKTIDTLSKTSRNLVWDHLITVIATFPDRMANKLQRQTKKLFYPENYFKILAKDTLQVLYVLYGEMKESRDCIISFISQLLGKICIQGYTDTYMGILLPRFIQLTQDDFIWQRLCCNIITRVPEIYLDCLMEYLLQNLPWYGTVSKLIGDSVLTNQKLTYIMTQKCLLLRHYQKELILHNIIGYLAHSTSRHGLFIETLKMLFDVWSDSSAMKHTSYEQHLYITKAILIALGHVNEGKMKTYKEVFMTKMMNGMQCHLDSPVMKIRRLGMIVAESLTQIIDSNSSPLKFEYQSDDESDHLISLLKPPEDQGVEDVTSNFSHCNLEEEDSACKAGVEQPTISDKMINMDDELDSDDDIEPYDMSADTKDSNTKQPMYIRDCMQGLVTQDDPERVQACLTVAQKLVRANPDNLSEICVEFVKLLLHTQDSYGMNNFTHLRHSAMVAITVHCPIQVAVYLTEEFFSRNYNIRQRMDILEVLASASQELSQPDKVLQSEAKTSIESWTSQYKDAPTNLVKNWREIVQERIESKTRRFSQKSHKEKATPVPNRFAPVAGYFFFPLLKKYDMSMSTLNLLNQDYLLLGRLIYTLGVIMHAAINTTCCHQMASSLLEFLWVVRYHSEAFVRQAILFSLSMVVLTIPSYSLVTTLQSDVIEFKQWLQDIIEKDPDTECKKLAIQTLMILETAFKKELLRDRSI